MALTLQSPLLGAFTEPDQGKTVQMKFAEVRKHRGLVSPDGHHFACSHSTRQPVRTIFLIDRSGSMEYADVKPQTMPWRRSHANRLRGYPL